MTRINLRFVACLSLVLVALGALHAQCTDDTRVYPYAYDGKNYEIIREQKTWIEAAQCAVERGGYLAEINDEAEQNALFSELLTNANILAANTVAPDGGGGAYVWLGGNDLEQEGSWVWDGDNDMDATPFWTGTSTGSPVDGRYQNWGNEPDDFNGQDALALSLDGWPRGDAGQWNDVDESNALYFVVEYSRVSSTKETSTDTQLELYPNPVTRDLHIGVQERPISSIALYNMLGLRLQYIAVDHKLGLQTLDLSQYHRGLYLLTVQLEDGTTLVRRIIKE